MARNILSLMVLLCGALQLSAAETSVDKEGRLQRLPLGKGWQILKSDIIIPQRGWSTQHAFSAVKSQASTLKDKRTWTAEVKTDDGIYHVFEWVKESEDKVTIDISVTAERADDIEGIIFWLDLPTDAYAGGTFHVGDEKGPLPKQLPEAIHLADERTDKASFFDAEHRSELKLETDRRTGVLVQDGRKWAQNFSALIYVHGGFLREDRTAHLQLTLSMKGDVDDRQAHLKLDTEKTRYTIQGIGGNYCFSTDSPVAKHTLETLNAGFARVEMSLDEWQPENDTDKPDADRWKNRVARDTDGSKLRSELELMQRFSAKKIPCVASAWRLPAWMYDAPRKDKFSPGGRLDSKHWNDMVENIGTYLQYAKEKYNAEPEYFSFNEPDIGITLKLTGEQHRDAIKKIGADLEKRGLKTRLLLADVASARDTDTYTVPAAEDKDARKYIGAVAMHTWGGANPRQYSDWADLADYLKLPLLVTEVGVDPDAWRTGAYKSYGYAMKEMAQYQEIFLHARPQAVLYWEYTNDYPLLTESKLIKDRWLETERFALQKHWTQFVPGGSVALGSESDHASVTFTAFKHTDGDAATFTLQLVNQGWTRKIVLEGLPENVESFNAVRTSEGEIFHVLDAVPVKERKIEMELPAQCMVTLTTMPVLPKNTAPDVNASPKPDAK